VHSGGNIVLEIKNWTHLKEEDVPENLTNKVSRKLLSFSTKKEEEEKKVEVELPRIQSQQIISSLDLDQELRESELAAKRKIDQVF